MIVRETFFAESFHKIRIGLYIPSLVYGGAERWTLDLVHFCDPSIVQWTGCVLPDNAWIDNRLLNRLSSMIPVYSEGYIWQRGHRQRTRFYDAVQTLLGNSELIVTWELDGNMRLLLDKLNRRVIHVAHRNDKDSISPMVRETDCLSVVWDSCKGVFGVPDVSLIQVIPNGIDLNRCFPIHKRNEIRELWNCTSYQLVVGYIGRLDPRKNIVALAKAVSALAQDAVGVVYGTKAAHSAGVEESMQALAPGQLRFVPPTEDIGSVLNAIDVFLMPSYEEVFSLSLLEAWGAGVPVVATKVGAISDLEKKYGELVVEISPNACGYQLADAIKKATSDLDHIVAIRNKAARMVHYNYNVHIMANEWTEYFKQCAQKGKQ